MKWAAGILGVMLYLVWPYYTLIELAQAIRSSDAAAINQLVDWNLVRTTSVKAQLQAHLASRIAPPLRAKLGSALAHAALIVVCEDHQTAHPLNQREARQIVGDGA